MAIVTKFVDNMDETIRFYRDVLGMKVESRYGDHFAMLKSTDGMTLGLHPATEKSPAGKIQLGFQTSGPIEEVKSSLLEKGVRTGPVVEDDPIRAVEFKDPDGVELYFAQVKRVVAS